MQQQQEAIAANERMQQEMLAWEKEKHYTSLQSEEKQEYIRTFINQQDNMKTGENAVPDILEYEKLSNDWSYKEKMLQVVKDKAALESKRRSDDMIKHKDNMALQQKKLKSNELLAKLKLKIAKVNPG